MHDTLRGLKRALEIELTVDKEIYDTVITFLTMWCPELGERQVVDFAPYMGRKLLMYNDTHVLIVNIQGDLEIIERLDT